MISWILLLFSIALAVTHSLWWLVLSVLIALFKLNKWWFYSSRPWRKVHFPMMRIHAAVLGEVMGNAERTGQQHDAKEVLIALVKGYYPHMGDRDAAAFVEREEARCRNFTDKQLVEDHVLSINKEITSEEVREILEKFRPHIKPDDQGFMVRMIIAGIIEKEFTDKDRGEYLYEVFMNRAN